MTEAGNGAEGFRSARENAPDMVILDRDILTCPEDEIQWIEPIQTILGGKVIYDSGDAL